MKVSITSDRPLVGAKYKIPGEMVADGFVEGPAEDIDAGASYTFEAEVDGRWYRWTGQRATVSFGRFYFELRGGTQIAAPT